MWFRIAAVNSIRVSHLGKILTIHSELSKILALPNGAGDGLPEFGRMCFLELKQHGTAGIACGSICQIS